MITITKYHLRESKDAKPFIALELQGSIELVQSLETGNFYATARKCSITSTFDEETAKRIIGTQMPGCFIRVQTEAYDFHVPKTGEVIQLAHTYQYRPEGYTDAMAKASEFAA